MKRFHSITMVLTLLIAAPAAAQDLLLRNVTLHNGFNAEVTENTDILIRDGRISDIGSGIEADAGIQVIDGAGKPVTPGLFGGLGAPGVVEVSGAASTVDNGYSLPLFRPEFQISTAYNPHGTTVGVTRIEGVTHMLLAPSTSGSILAGQGRVAKLNGEYRPWLGDPVLLVDIGGNSSALTGGSRAAQYMHLRQAFTESQSRGPSNGPHQMLTEPGRNVLSSVVDNGWRVLFRVDRASDILQVLEFARRQQLNPVIVGGAEAWMVADALAGANVPVILNPLGNEPESFDELGARLDNAALLHEAGVRIAFSVGESSHNARKVRQGAGVAVAYGLPWHAALAALTSSPAEILGFGRRHGRIAEGFNGDLVLWSGDPLEVTTVADQVIMGGAPIPMVSRQTKLRDRYLNPNPELPRAYIKP